MDDAELLAAVKVNGMVDPFALTEAVTRGIWRDERPARAGGIAHQMQRMGVVRLRAMDVSAVGERARG